MNNYQLTNATYLLIEQMIIANLRLKGAFYGS